jgi:hypothetical protein
MNEETDATARRTLLFPIGLAIITALAALLRLWSIGFGLPLITHPDEPLIYDAADRMISGRTLNPHWFRYPAFIIDIETALLSIVYALDHTIGLSEDMILNLGYGSGRLVMATFGILTVALTGLLGRRLARAALNTNTDDGPFDQQPPNVFCHPEVAAEGSLRAGYGQTPGDPSLPLRMTERRRWLPNVTIAADIAGLVAALLLAVSFIHMKDSHYLKPDIPTAFFTTLTLWLTWDAWEKRASGHLRPWLLAGLAVGLATAAKYTGGVVAIVPAMALLLAVLDGSMRFGRAVKVTAAMAGAAIVVFLVVNPYIALSPREFLSPVDGIRAEMNHYRTGHDGAEGNDTWRWYLWETWHHGFGPTLTPLVIAGGALAIGWVGRRSRGWNLLLPALVFVPLYYATIAPYPVRFDRQLMPILPYMAILGGFAVAVTLSWLRDWRIEDRVRIAFPAVALALVVLLAIPPGLEAAHWDIETGKRDTRYAALDWIKANIPPGATIAREWHTPPIEQAGYHDVYIRAVYEQSLAWYENVGAQYLVLSSFLYQRYLDDPALYPNESAFYQRILAMPRLGTFEGDNGPVVVIIKLEDAAPAFETPSMGVTTRLAIEPAQ